MTGEGWPDGEAVTRRCSRKLVWPRLVGLAPANKPASKLGRVAAAVTAALARLTDDTHLTGRRNFVMLDFTSDIAADTPSSRAAEHTPINDQALLDAYSNAVIGVTERVGPAVVRVETGPKVRNPRERGGLGSGIVISPDGLVLTNSHVVGSSKEIRLRDTEGFVTDAHVLGVDPDT